MHYDFDKIIDRTHTNSVKWEFMQVMESEVTADTLPFWVADMDFPCAEPILTALHNRTEQKVFGYSSHDTPEFFQAVCGWYQNRFNWNVDPAHLAYSPGVVPAIGFILDLLTKPGEGVIIQRPVYHPFTNIIESRSRVVVNNPLINQDGDYRIDYADLEKKAQNPDTKVMILCSPHNPVGRVWQKDELLRLGKICLQNNVFIISDEIHCDLLRRGIRHTPLETLFPREQHRIITTTAPSKTFNLAGMQFSNIIIRDDELREAWALYVKGRLAIMGPTPLSIAATQAAYSQGEEWLEQVLDYLDENISFMQSYLAEHLPKARFSPPEGTYLAWVDFSSYGYTHEALYKKLVCQAQVLPQSGTVFGSEGMGFMRFNIACPRSVLREGLKRVAAVLNQETNPV
ncbi:MalY/PatB family protein [Dethiobacter alkaliphilus]|uniref:cysteine-S-conjugate beta-lyase n=1 Tax=Dethiobacter alkaliphilus AHT 1 TaxID=555088 RepID=C0GDE2_DETAL|nr:MalY/PatB family protein [Dethiobacter alkaliphilus]EEG78663.1 aminotransferase class I and II [Dethiobacter alkaliphilus AHT 1]